MGRNGCLWFLFLSLSFLTTSGIRILNTIDDLADSNIEFGKTFPRHGLKLLYWLSRHVEIDQNDVIQLLNITPSRDDFGFHPFYNRPKRGEQSIFPNDNNFFYYSLGNLNGVGRQFPQDVTVDFFNTRSPDTISDIRLDANRDRIVFQTYQGNSQRGRRLYITQHPRGSNAYDGNHTYEISSQLLREIQSIPTQADFLRQVRYNYINSNNRYQTIFQCKPSIGMRYRREAECDTLEGLKLAVLPDDNAKARITWSNIPKSILKSSLYLKLYSNMDSNKELGSYKVGEQQFGSRGTNVSLAPGLQLRLVETAWLYADKQIWVSPEFDEANRKLPTNVVGYDASLQLFVKKGKACARLYIQKSFTDWTTTFENSWVGFYKSSDDEHNNYEAYTWALYFSENQERHTDTYLAYESEFGSDMHHDVQARFFLHRAYTSVKAHTGTWANEDVKKFVNLAGYDASVQLFAKGGKACARLYIKNSFTDWKERFTNAWVGFFNHSDDGHSSYKDWQYVTWLTENTYKHTETSKAYEYKSKLDIQGDVQVRFFLQKAYPSVLAHTLPWGGDAIRKIVNNVRDYGASLQLIANKGKVCARLFIKNSFTDWKIEFADSWVGFFNSASDLSNSYEKYQWVTWFKKNEDKCTEEYMAYDYCMNKNVVEARFFLKNDYDSVICRTKL